MSPRLHVIMPTSRPGNLAKIVKCYLQDMEPHPFELRWHLMVQGPEPDPKGYRKSNEGALLVPTQMGNWLWFPSDDSLQPTSLFRQLGMTIGLYPEASMIVFSQRRKGVCPWTGGAWPTEPGVLLAAPGNMRRCHVDCTQCFFAGHTRPFFDFGEFGDEADGAFIERVWQQDKTKVIFVPQNFVFWGSLDP